MKSVDEIRALDMVDRYLDAISAAFDREPSTQPWHVEWVRELDRDYQTWKRAARKGRHTPESLAAAERVALVVKQIAVGGRYVARNRYA